MPDFNSDMIFPTQVSLCRQKFFKSQQTFHLSLKSFLTVYIKLFFFVNINRIDSVKYKKMFIADCISLDERKPYWTTSISGWGHEDNHRIIALSIFASIVRWYDDAMAMKQGCNYAIMWSRRSNCVIVCWQWCDNAMTTARRSDSAMTRLR